MTDILKVMILEDQDVDQLIVKKQVLKYNPNSVFTIVEGKADFFEKINWFLPDLILADYHLPDFTGLDALMYIKEHSWSVPFIFVTGGLKPNDALANVVLRLADGYILKDDMSNLSSHIETIVDGMKDQEKKENKRYRQKISQRIKLLKAIELLQNSDAFTEKEEIIELLQAFCEQDV